jgi:hypothetical protein
MFSKVDRTREVIIVQLFVFDFKKRDWVGIGGDDGEVESGYR